MGGEKRRERKSLRNRVHHANAVGWGPVALSSARCFSASVTGSSSTRRAARPKSSLASAVARAIRRAASPTPALVSLDTPLSPVLSGGGGTSHDFRSASWTTSASTRPSPLTTGCSRCFRDPPATYALGRFMNHGSAAPEDEDAPGPAKSASSSMDSTTGETRVPPCISMDAATPRALAASAGART
eukprot:31500-Pelagococcus_subviridis.AAC.7